MEERLISWRHQEPPKALFCWDLMSGLFTMIRQNVPAKKATPPKKHNVGSTDTLDLVLIITWLRPLRNPEDYNC